MNNSQKWEDQKDGEEEEEERNGPIILERVGKSIRFPGSISASAFNF